MPASRKSDGSIKRTTKVVATLKRKASKVVKALLPKKKRKGPTGDTISLSNTSSNKSDEPSIIDSSTGQTDAEEAEEVEEAADAQLGMSPLSSCDKKRDAHYDAQNI
jgi:hypothetical protein